MTVPLSAKNTRGYTLIKRTRRRRHLLTVLVTCVSISKETSYDIVHSHIKTTLFISMTPSLSSLFLINRNDYWIVG